jgi:putative DNA primase/helicase
MAPVDGAKPKAKGRSAAAARLAYEDEGDVDEIDHFLAWRDMNDTGNAERFVKRVGEEFRHVRQRGWHGWDELIWNGDIGEEMALKAAQRVAQAIRQEVKALQSQKKTGRDSDRVTYLIQHAQQSGNVGRLNNMLIAAAPELALSLEDMDAVPFLLYCQNAALQLFPSQKVVPRERNHYVTKLARAHYRPGVECPKWEKFVGRIFPDDDVRRFVQRALGYSLTGDMSEEAFFLCWGMGRNGKGTLLRTVSYVLGSYAATIPIELLLKKNSPQSGNEAQPQFSQLPATRFVITSEPGPGVAFDEGLLQTITGRDKIRIRDMYGKPFDMLPQFKLWIAVNDRPGVRSSSNAYWRRVKSIPFRVSIANDEVNPHLERELHEERDGILNWILEGLAEWSDKGLAPPEEVLSANQSYRDEMDPLHRFLAECVVMRVDWTTAKKDIAAAYGEWCVENREEPMKDRSFGLAMSTKGYRRKHSNGTFYRDIELTAAGHLFADRAEQKTKKSGFLSG